MVILILLTASWQVETSRDVGRGRERQGETRNHTEWWRGFLPPLRRHGKALASHFEKLVDDFVGSEVAKTYREGNGLGVTARDRRDVYNASDCLAWSEFVDGSDRETICECEVCTWHLAWHVVCLSCATCCTCVHIPYLSSHCHITYWRPQFRYVSPLILKSSSEKCTHVFVST